MAVTLTVDELRAALRAGSDPDEMAEVTRLLAFASEAVTKHAPDTPDVVHNEAAIRLSGYLFDMPNASRGAAFANALQNSGAASILLPYRTHRAGSVANTRSALKSATIADLAPAAGVTEARVGELIEAHRADSTAHHTPPTVPALPMPATPAEAAGGTSTTIRSWTAALIRAAIEAVVPAVFRTGNTDRFDVAKMGSGTADATTLLYGNGAWGSPPAAAVDVTRLVITFDASSYSYLSEADSGIVGGISYLTATYPAGLDQASAAAAIKFGYLDIDPHQSTKAAGPLLEFTETIMRGHTEGVSVRFNATEIRLDIGGIELAAANQRDTWRIRLGMVG